ncbi:MAG: ion channel [Bacteroidota bacterium]
MSNAQDNAPGAQATDEKNRELGFGTRVYRRRLRLINKDGSFNVVKRGRANFRWYDLYHQLITMHWAKLVGLILLYYLVINIIFSVLYLAVGLENLEGTVGETPFMQFMDAFFFSAQTVTTLGYGRISPVGTSASIIAAIESLVGLMGFALVTGLLYGRFARPAARIKFSDVALIAPYRGITGLMIRLANERSSELIEVEAQIIYSFIDPDTNRRRFTPLELELKKVNFLSLAWTLVHPINEDSPMQGKSPEDLARADAEFLILLKGFDDSFATYVYQRSSYKYWEVIFGAKFKSITRAGDDEMLHVDLSRIGEYEEVEL